MNTFIFIKFIIYFKHLPLLEVKIKIHASLKMFAKNLVLLIGQRTNLHVR